MHIGTWEPGTLDQGQKTPPLNGVGRLESQRHEQSSSRRNFSQDRREVEGGAVLRGEKRNIRASCRQELLTRHGCRHATWFASSKLVSESLRFVNNGISDSSVSPARTSSPAARGLRTICAQADATNGQPFFSTRVTRLKTQEAIRRNPPEPSPHRHSKSSKMPEVERVKGRERGGEASEDQSAIESVTVVG